jgi:hypothetical protein
MRYVRLIALAMVVLGLGAYIFFFERHQPTTDQRKEQEGKLFATLDQAKARHIVVTNAKGRFELAKDKDNWSLVAPLADQANTSAVTSLLSTLSTLKSERTLEAKEVKLADFGLDKPLLSVTVEDDGGKSYALKVGNELPLGNNRAAMTDAGHVYMISKWIANDLDKDLAGWRSDELAQVFAGDVASATVARAGSRVALAHTGSVWTLTEPVADLADRERADGLVGDISAARIKEFVDAPGPFADYGLEPPAVSVTLIRRGEKAAPIQLAFGINRDKDGAKQVACKRGERVLWVDAKAVERAVADPAEWRSKKLVQFDSWSADGLVMTAGAAKASLERKDGIWRAAGAEVDSDAVSRRLGVLSDLAVLAFDKPKPTGAPAGTVKLTIEGPSAIDASFYLEPEAVAVVSGRSGALAVDAGKVKELLADPASLAKPKPTPAPTPTAAKSASPAPKK